MPVSIHEEVRVALKLCLHLLPPTLASARVVRYKAGAEWAVRVCVCFETEFTSARLCETLLNTSVFGSSVEQEKSATALHMVAER